MVEIDLAQIDKLISAGDEKASESESSWAKKTPKEKKPRFTSKKRKPRPKKRKSYESGASEEEGDADQENKSPEKVEKVVVEGQNGLEEADLMDLETRRSGRVTKRKKYNQDDAWDELGLSEDEGKGGKLTAKDMKNMPTSQLFFIDVPGEDELQVVEKILSIRTRKVKKEVEGDDKTIAPEGEAEPEPDSDVVDEYFVKYKNFSYIHCEWKTEEELEIGDKRVGGKIRRFLEKRRNIAQYFETIDEDEPFNPDYLQVDINLKFYKYSASKIICRKFYFSKFDL